MALLLVLQREVFHYVDFIAYFTLHPTNQSFMLKIHRIFILGLFRFQPSYHFRINSVHFSNCDGSNNCTYFHDSHFLPGTFKDRSCILLKLFVRTSSNKRREKHLIRSTVSLN